MISEKRKNFWAIMLAAMVLLGVFLAQVVINNEKLSLVQAVVCK